MPARASIKFVSKQPALGAALRHLEIQATAIGMHATRCQMFDLFGAQFAVTPRHHAPGPRLFLHTLLHTLAREIWRERVELGGTPDSAQVAGSADFYVSNWSWLKFSETSFWRREWDSNPRYSFPHTRFPSVRLKPLGHLSGCLLLKATAAFCKREPRLRSIFLQPIDCYRYFNGRLIRRGKGTLNARGRVADQFFARRSSEGASA